MRLEELTQEKNSSSKLVPSLFNERNLIRNSSPLTEYYDEYENELYNNSSQMDEMTHELMEDMDDMQRMMYSMKPRCFSMCEPTELFFRQVLPQILLFNQKVSFGDRFFVDFTFDMDSELQLHNVCFSCGFSFALLTRTLILGA